MLPWAIVGVCLLLLVWLAGSALAYQLWLVLMGTAVVLTVAVPFLAAAAAARLMTEDINSGHYLSVAMTNLSNRDLIDAYFYAGLYRVRGAAWLLALVLSSAALGSVWFEMRANPAADVGALLLLWLLLPVQLAGLCGGVAAVGVVLALRYRGPIISTTAVPLLALALTLGGLFLLVRALLLSAPGAGATWLFWGQLPLLVLAPYALMAVCLWVARRLARRL